MWKYQTSSRVINQGPCPKKGCGSSDAYTEYEDGHFHCYSCNYHISPGSAEAHLKVLLKSSLKTKKKFEVYLPDDTDRHIPPEPLNWLYGYGITQIEIITYKIVWSDRLNSLIFPVFGSDSNLLMYQTRYFGDDYKTPKWRTIGDHANIIHLPNEFIKHSHIVLVEDILSAIKVSRCTNCMPLFGSSLPENLSIRLSKLFKRCKVWLDPDMKEKSLRMALKLSEVGLPSTVIFSDFDPKVYTNKEIYDMVNPNE